MKRSTTLLAVAAAALFLVFASSTPVALAQDGHQVIVPASSIEYPWDIGVRAHTNIIMVKLSQSETEGFAPPVDAMERQVIEQILSGVGVVLQEDDVGQDHGEDAAGSNELNSSFDKRPEQGR